MAEDTTNIKEPESSIHLLRSVYAKTMMPQMLSFMLTLFVVAIVYLLFYKGVPVESKESLLLILGIVIKEWGSSMQYWFGTSNGSKDKDNIIAQSTPVTNNTINK